MTTNRTRGAKTKRVTTIPKKTEGTVIPMKRIAKMKIKTLIRKDPINMTATIQDLEKEEAWARSLVTDVTLDLMTTSMTTRETMISPLRNREIKTPLNPN